jgi:uncharacterized membrane protein YedE/YeeE
MKKLLFLPVGILFGITMYKSEAISWYRIQEMFLFDSFHMYGIIGVAVVLGVGLHLFLKSSSLKNVDGESYSFADKPSTYKASIIGGTIFGLGWAITGACPGPIYVLIGAGYGGFIVVLIAAIVGALIYGALKKRLPH